MCGIMRTRRNRVGEGPKIKTTWIVVRMKSKTIKATALPTMLKKHERTNSNRSIIGTRLINEKSRCKAALVVIRQKLKVRGY